MVAGRWVLAVLRMELAPQMGPCPGLWRHGGTACRDGFLLHPLPKFVAVVARAPQYWRILQVAVLLAVTFASPPRVCR